MGFAELVHKRYSVRGYKPDAVEEEKLQQILEAARWAPTGGNRQQFQLVVIHTEGREEDVRRIYGQDWFVQAPIVICACRTSVEHRPDRPSYGGVNIGIVMDHLILAATELGLGTCWIGAFDREATREILGLPDDVDPVVCTPLGYPDAAPRPRQRKPVSELVRYEHW
jgi:nitroreductase